MSWFIVDVESDGPIPAVYSMICFGAVKLDDDLKTTFYGKTRPISDNFNPEVLAVSGFSRDEHYLFQEPKEVMSAFETWVLEHNSQGRPTFVSDNPAFDWQWINYYMHYYIGRNCFGFSARRIGDLYAGMCKRANAASEWKKFRKTRHTHHPVDDAKGNAEALLEMQRLGLKIV